MLRRSERLHWLSDGFNRICYTLRIMNSQPLALDVPNLLIARLNTLSQITHRPVETLVLQVLDTNVPPMLAELPEEIQRVLSGLDTMSDELLMQIARSTFDAKQQSEYSRLVRKQQSYVLSESETSRLSQLVQLADQHMVRKAYANAILKFRGLPLPSLPQTIVGA